VVANISHDLRTPLGSIHGYLETLSLKDETLDAAERQRYLGIALSQSRKVGRWRKPCLNWRGWNTARCTGAGAVLAVRPDTGRVPEIRTASAGAEDPPDGDLPHPAPMVRADLGMIERVLTNLFDNAIRHTPAGGEVEITVAGGAGKVEVTVADTGPGVPASCAKPVPPPGRAARRIPRRRAWPVDRQPHPATPPQQDRTGQRGGGAVFRFTLDAA
jgi:K+-sensing histidine kinase KdpD